MSTTALRRADRIGFAASVLCAIHCALLPVLLGVLPFLELEIGGMDLDLAFAVFATVLGATTFALGWRRHRALRAGMVLLAGLALVWTGGLTHAHASVLHAVWMACGGLLVATAHFINLHLTHVHTRTCGCRPDPLDGAQVMTATIDPRQQHQTNPCADAC